MLFYWCYSAEGTVGGNTIRKEKEMEKNEIRRGIYRHYKGGMYEVIDIARHSETLEVLVIYRNVATGEYWARPISMWNETVVIEGDEVPRFRFLSDGTEKPG